jgi:SAM-dependent methyltransferase
VFLRQAAVADALDRVRVVNRSFPRVLDLLGYRDLLTAAVASDPVLAGRVGRVISARDAMAWTAGPSVLCDAERLPFAPGSFDLILAPMALHWINDLPGLLIQLRTLLSPDGLLIASALGGRTLHELRACLIEAEAATTGGASVRISPMIEVQDAARLMQRAGFAMPVADIDRIRVTYAEPMRLLSDLQAMGESAAFTPAGAPRRPLRRDTLRLALNLYAQRFGDSSGRLAATFELVTFSGWAPSHDQPRPLRPGSAKMRLADALGVTEHSAGEKAGGA